AGGAVLRGDPAAVERTAPRVSLQRVGRVHDLVVLQILGLVAGFVGHASVPLLRSPRARRIRAHEPKLPGRPTCPRRAPVPFRIWLSSQDTGRPEAQATSGR